MKLIVLYPEHLAFDLPRVRQQAETMAGLARAGVEVHFVFGWFGSWRKRLEQLKLSSLKGLIPHPVAMCQKGPGSKAPLNWHGLYFSSVKSCLKKLNRQGAEIVLVRHLKLANHLAPLASKLNIKLIYEAHELFSQTALEEGMAKEKLAKLTDMENRVLKTCDRVIAISRPLAKALEDKVSCKTPLTVVASGVGKEFFVSQKKWEANGLIAYAGSLAPWKGVDLLLRASALLPDIKLEILGGEENSRDWRRLKKLANELNLGEKVIMRPKAGQDKVRELLRRSTVAVWPGCGKQAISRDFTSPLKLFEYMASKNAVVAPSLPAATAVLENNEQALLFTADDHKSLAQALNTLSKDQAKAKRLGENAGKAALKYTWDKRAEIIMGVIEEMSN